MSAFGVNKPRDSDLNLIVELLDAPIMEAGINRIESDTARQLCFNRFGEIALGGSVASPRAAGAAGAVKAGNCDDGTL